MFIHIGEEQKDFKNGHVEKEYVSMRSNNEDWKDK